MFLLIRSNLFLVNASFGAIPSCEACDILMYQIMKEILSKFKDRKKKKFYGRYRDDGFMIYNGNFNDIPDCFNTANNHHLFLKFTHEISQTQKPPSLFLDVNIYKGKRIFINSIFGYENIF